MRKVAIRIVGSLFILEGLVEIINFFWTGTQPATPLHINIFGYDIGGFLFVIVLLGTGISIIKLKNSGRIWGLVILWLALLSSFIAVVVSFMGATNPEASNLSAGSIIFKGTAYGLSRDYIISNPWSLFAISVVLLILDGVQIRILASKKSKVYFTVETTTGS